MKTEYRETTDDTSIGIIPEEFSKTAFSGGEPHMPPHLYVSTTFDGKKPRNVEFVIFGLMTISRDLQYASCSGMRVMADGKRVDLGAAGKSSKAKAAGVSLGEPFHDQDAGKGYVAERIQAIISIETLKKLSRSKKIEGEICGTLFKISPAEIRELKGLYKLLTGHE